MIADARRAAEMTLLTVDTVAIDMILLTVDTRGAARQRRRMRHAEAGAVSRAKRILSGEDTVFLWRDLARGVVQREEMQLRLQWGRRCRCMPCPMCGQPCTGHLAFPHDAACTHPVGRFGLHEWGP